MTLAAVGIAVGAFGSVKLSKYLLRSDFDKQVARYISLMKRRAESPNDKTIEDKLVKTTNRIDELVANANSKELADKYNKKIKLAKDKLEKSKSYKDYKDARIKNLEEDLAKLEAEGIDDDEFTEFVEFTDLIELTRGQIPQPAQPHRRATAIVLT